MPRGKPLFRLVEVWQQGAKWERFEQRKINCSDCWCADFSIIQFLKMSVYDVLPSSVYLNISGMNETPNCVLCGSRSLLQGFRGWFVSLAPRSDP